MIARPAPRPGWLPQCTELFARREPHPPDLAGGEGSGHQVEPEPAHQNLSGLIAPAELGLSGMGLGRRDVPKSRHGACAAVFGERGEGPVAGSGGLGVTPGATLVG